MPPTQHVSISLEPQPAGLTRCDDPDPITYLDVLSLSEGCILIICASLPALGPLFRAGWSKLSTIYGTFSGRSKGTGTDTTETSTAPISHTNVTTNGKSWLQLRPDTFDTTMQSTVIHHTTGDDDLAYFPVPGQVYQYNSIHRTMEYSVHSENFLTVHSTPDRSLELIYQGTREDGSGGRFDGSGEDLVIHQV
jgi:hypothetical protein